MKKAKQILAIICILFLVALYLITLICAITDSTGTMNMFKASVYATVIIPALLWIYSFIYQLLKKHYGPDSEKKEKDNISESGSANKTDD